MSVSTPPVSWKQAKIDKFVLELKALDLNFESKNDNVHIVFHIDEIRFDCWPSTEKMWVTNLDTGKKKTFVTAESGLYEIKRVLFSL